MTHQPDSSSDTTPSLGLPAGVQATAATARRGTLSAQSGSIVQTEGSGRSAQPTSARLWHWSSGPDGSPLPEAAFLAFIGITELALSFADAKTPSGTPIPVGVSIALCVLYVLPLWWRARLPLVVFALEVALACATHGVMRSLPFAALAAATFAVARRMGAVPALAALGVVVVPLGLNAYTGATWNGDDTTLTQVAQGLGIWFALFVVIWGLGRLLHRSEWGALANERAQAAAAAAAMEAQRQQIARELHDILAHSVSAMILQAAGARAVATRAQPPTNPQVMAALGAIEDTGAQAMRELHRMLGLLREQGEDPAQLSYSERPGMHEIEALATRARDAGLIVDLREIGEPVELDPSVDLAGYRVIQESLSNAMRHGGRGGRAEVTVTWSLDALSVQTRSRSGVQDPSAPAPVSGGYGLRGLRERVALVGGRFEAGPVEDGSFLTSAHFDVSRPEERS